MDTNMKLHLLSGTLVILISIISSAVAATDNDEVKIDRHKNLEKLDKTNFLPSLLPVILENSDVIELTDKQVETLLEWRKVNRGDVIATMNEIARKRVEIKEAALSPDISSARLIQMQNEVFRLQRIVLEYKLSCRDLIINTFNTNNWEGFYLVLAESEMGVRLPELYVSSR